MKNDIDKSIIGQLKSAWILIAGLIGAITVVVQFIQLWQGDRATVTWVITGFSFAGLFFALLYVSFSKRTYHSSINHLSNKKHSWKEMRYLKHFRYARIGLMLFVFLGFIAGLALRSQLESLDDKVLILVVGFDGPNSQEFRLTEQLIVSLHNLLDQYDDTLIRLSSKTITENEGSEIALELGRRYHADFVVWGWYGATESNALLTIHVEKISQREFNPLPTSGLAQSNVSIADVQSFTLQQRVGDQIGALALFISGYARYSAGDYEGAVVRFTDAMNQESWSNDLFDKSRVFFYRGTALLYAHEYDRAISDFAQAIQITPLYLAAHINRGVAYYENGDLQSSLSNFSKAISLYPDEESGYGNRAHIYLKLGQYQNALKDINRCIELFPDNPDFLIFRGQVYYEVGEFQKAINDYGQVIKTGNSSVGAYNGRGLALASSGQHDKAVADFNFVVNLAPNEVVGYINRGNSFLALGKLNEAIADFEKAIKINPQYAESYNNLGLVFSQHGIYEVAIEYFDQAIKINPNYIAALNNRGIAYNQLKQYKLAIVDFNKILELEPQDGVAFYERGVAYKGVGSLSQALDDLNNALSFCGNNELLCDEAKKEIQAIESK